MKVIVPDYDEKSDDELLRLTLESDSLTSEARDALQIELKKRSLDSPTRLAKFSDDQKRLKHLDEVNLGRLVLSWRGNGRRPYGKSNVEVSGTSEEYDTTIFAVVSYFPLIPFLSRPRQQALPRLGEEASGLGSSGVGLDKGTCNHRGSNIRNGHSS